MEHGPAVGGPEVDRQPSLRAVVDDPAVVVRAFRNARSTGAMAIGIAGGWLELDDVSAEVRQDGRSHRARDEARGVDDPQAREQHHSALAGRSLSSRRASSATPTLIAESATWLCEPRPFDGRGER